MPSLSVTLSGLTTTTTVTFDEAFQADSFLLGGRAAPLDALSRTTELLERVRLAANLRCFARVESSNDFPTASGLASSASGFAALALAATHAAELDWTTEQIAALARASSASAARSLFGGFVALEGERAWQVAPPSQIDLRVLVCVTTEAPKEVSSRLGMERTRLESPYYDAWLSTAPKIHAELRAALERSDFDATCALAESSALAMHASAFAAGVVYVSGATLRALREVQAMRTEGLRTYATMDAGPHLKCLVHAEDASRAASRLAGVEGVLRILEAFPGEGATLTHRSVVSGDAS